jgi:adenylate kinase
MPLTYFPARGNEQVNPEFDTYRMGSVLEMVRNIVLRLVLQFPPLRVRICVQQSLGEGIFTGLPISLSSMGQVLETMDWGGQLKDYEKFQRTDGEAPRAEALLRFGALGADQVAPDDDVILVISPQNGRKQNLNTMHSVVVLNGRFGMALTVVNGPVVPLLEEMVRSANGRPLFLINPRLQDVPSGNNVMQVKGRAERRAFAATFRDIFAFRVKYPPAAGRMYPIRGLLVKKTHGSPWVVYRKEERAQDESEEYSIAAAFAPDHPPSDVEVALALR